MIFILYKKKEEEKVSD